MPLVLQTLGGDQTLDLGGLGVGLLALALGLDLSSDDILANLLFRGGDTHVISLLLRDFPLRLYPNCFDSTNAVVGQAMTRW